jgi:hypothetical protein
VKVMVLIKATKNSEAGLMPDERLLTEMGAYNEALAKAGILLSGEGLHPSSKAARVILKGDQRTQSRGPFSDLHGLIAGFWIWNVQSLDEALDWASRCPHPMPGEEAELELRQVFESSDFGAEFTQQLREQEERLREETQKRNQT